MNSAPPRNRATRSNATAPRTASGTRPGDPPRARPHPGPPEPGTTPLSAVGTTLRRRLSTTSPRRFSIPADCAAPRAIAVRQAPSVVPSAAAVREPSSGPERGDAVDRSESQRVSDAIVQAYKTQYGKGPEAIRVHLTGDTAMALLRGGFSVAEESLYGSGNAEAVRDQRRAFGDLIAPTLRVAINEELGREVVAVLADTCQHPDLTAIVLVLGDRT